MSLEAKDSGGGDFQIISTGVKVARCVWMIDLGTHHNPKFDKTEHKVLVSWEVPGELMDDGRPFFISNRYTVSLHEKANLRKDLESWRGKTFTDAELEGFDLRNVLDVPCYINVIHNESDGKTYANIASIMPLPKEMKCPAAVNDIVAFDIDDYTSEQLNALPEWIQTVINKSDEVSGDRQETPNPQSSEEHPPVVDSEGTPF